MRAVVLASLTLLSALAAPLTASAQAFGIRITPTGMDRLTEIAMTRVPTSYRIPSMTRELYDCPGSGVISASIPDTDIFLGWNDLSLTTEDGRIVVGVNLDVDVSTPVHLENPYACLGSADCSATASLDRLGVTVELAAGSGPDGKVEFHGAMVDIAITPEDLSVESAGCAVGEVATWLFNAVERWALDLLLPRLEALASDRISAMLTETFGETLGLTVVRDDLTIEGWLDALELRSDLGVTAAGGARITWTGPEQYVADPPPVSEPSAVPLPRDMIGQIQIAASDRLVTEALFEAWRGGMISRMLADRSQSIQLGGTGAAQQIGLPSGTEIDISFDIEQPLVTTFGRVAPGVTQVELRGLHVQVDVAPPDADPSRIDLIVNGSLAASLRADDQLGALVLDIRGIVIDSAEIQGEGGGLTIDGARIRAFVQGTVVPMLAERLGGLPIAPAVLPIAGTVLHVRTVRSEDGWERVGIDLFTPDPGDGVAPSTTIDDAQYLLPAGTARFAVSGHDDATPDELLRYRAWLDGVPLRDGETTSIREVRFDATDGYHVLEVTAVDLNGNEDPSPARHEMAVDGVPPDLVVTEFPSAIVTERWVRAAWRASDALGGAIESRYELRRIEEDDTTTILSESPFGADRGQLELSADDLEIGELYRLDIIVRDEAGNLTSESFGFALSPSLAGGCSASGAGTGSGTLLLPLALLMFMGGASWRRRR